MLFTSNHSAHYRVVRHLLNAIACLAVIAGGSPEVLAEHPSGEGETTPTLVRVEEDWELVLTTAVPNTSCPQVCCVISPDGNIDGVYATVEINQRSLTSNETGGLQLQVWDGENRLGPVKAVGSGSLVSAETVSWTTSMRVKDGALTFEVLNGYSTTWGRFGTTSTATLSSGEDLIIQKFSTSTTFGTTTYATDDDSSKTLLLTSTDPLYSAVTTTKTDLSSYNATVSIQESAVTYGGNLVQSLTLKAVRGYLSDGTVITENVARLVHANNQRD